MKPRVETQPQAAENICPKCGEEFRSKRDVHLQRAGKNPMPATEYIHEIKIIDNVNPTNMKQMALRRTVSDSCIVEEGDK